MLKVLLPLDGSEMAERAIPHALAVVRPFVAKVTLLRVVTPAEFRFQDTFSRIDWHFHKHQALTYLQSVTEQFEEAAVLYELRVGEGRPAEVILETARACGTHLLVMSTHGSGGALDFPRGGDVSKTLSAFDASVLIVGGTEAARTDNKARYRRLLVPIDGSYGSDCILRVAMILGESLDAELIIASINAKPAPPFIVRRNRKAESLCHELAELTRVAAERRLSEIKAQLPKEISVRTVVLMARRPVDELGRIVRRFDADLLVASDDLFDGAMDVVENQLSRFGVPALILSPNSIGQAFSELRHDERNDVTSADAN